MTEITVENDPYVLTPVDPVHYEVTFDGGAKAMGEGRVAGVGATLWGPPDAEGARGVLRTSRLALPEEQYAQVAEAWGCRLALELVGKIKGRPSQVRIVGDNLAVVRFGAGEGRLQRAHMAALIGPAIGALHLRGWSLQWEAVRRRHFRYRIRYFF